MNDMYQVYEDRLSGKLKKFPNFFFDGVNGKNRAIEITRYLIEEKLKMNDEELKNVLSIKFFRIYKLGTVLCQQYKEVPFNLINDVYPDKFKPWEFVESQVPRGFWCDETVSEALRWLVEDKLKGIEICSITEKDLRDNGLGSLLVMYSSTVGSLMINYYCDDFKEWEYKSVGNRFWDDKNNVYKALHWLFKERLKWSENEIFDKTNVLTFRHNKLEGMLITAFNYEYNAAIDFYFNYSQETST